MFVFTGTFLLYAGISTLGFIFIFTLLPETKGKPLEEVIDLFSQPVCTCCGGKDSIKYQRITGEGLYVTQHIKRDVTQYVKRYSQCAEFMLMSHFNDYCFKFSTNFSRTDNQNGNFDRVHMGVWKLMLLRYPNQTFRIYYKRLSKRCLIFQMRPSLQEIPKLWLNMSDFVPVWQVAIKMYTVLYSTKNNMPYAVFLLILDTIRHCFLLFI